MALKGITDVDGANILRVQGTDWHGKGRCHGRCYRLQGERHGLESRGGSDADSADNLRVKATNWRGGGGAHAEGINSVPVKDTDWSGQGPLTPKVPTPC